jgi:hypothetical protein
MLKVILGASLPCTPDSLHLANPPEQCAHLVSGVVGTSSLRLLLLGIERYASFEVDLGLALHEFGDIGRVRTHLGTSKLRRES